MATVVQALLTAEEYGLLDDPAPSELVRGRIVPVTRPKPRHGWICWQIAMLLGLYVKDRNCGKLIMNDGAVITGRGPDTVRGPDVAFYSHERVPPGMPPPGYLDAMPEVVFEVRSPSDRWSEILTKVAEYLEAGVRVVCVVDEPSRSVHVYRPEDAPVRRGQDEELVLPEVPGEFRVVVGRIFE